MMADSLARTARAAAAVVALAACLSVAQAQQQPSPAAVELAKELLALKGVSQMWAPVVPGVIERARTMFLQSNINLAKELNEIAAKLRADSAPKVAELSSEAARLYAERFTEQELKDALAFYKTPLGRKLVTEEPQILLDSATRIQAWAEKYSDEVISKMRAEMKKKGHDL